MNILTKLAPQLHIGAPRKLVDVAKHRENIRSGRTPMQTIALVGYTNAGKSSLLRALSGQHEIVVEDRLFATLDTLTREVDLGEGYRARVTDTVGFIRKLPHHLVASFRATLEEAVHADLRLHVIDASHPLAIDQMYAVRGVLEELGCDPATTVSVINKVDAAKRDALEDVRRAAQLSEDGSEFLHGGVLEVSAVTGQGLDDLRDLVARCAREGWVRIDVDDAAANGRLRAFAHQHGTVRSERFDEARWLAEVELPVRLVSEFERLRSR